MTPLKPTVFTDDMFCGRKKETKYLVNNMLSGIHTVVYAPRHCGKSSLAHIVLSRLKKQMVGVYVDFFTITSLDDVASKLYRCIFKALGTLSGDKIDRLNQMAEFFKNLQLGISIDPVSKSPEITVRLGNEPVDTYIAKVIDSLDAYCEKHRLKVCLVLDEFQEICNLKDSKKIEGLLRGGMQMAKHVTFMMLGSRRSALNAMFIDIKRPFYHSTDIMPLQKIPEEALVDIIERTFKKEGASIPLGEAQQIIEYCNSYPDYVRKLSILYSLMKINGISLAETGELLVTQEAKEFESLFLNLTLHQKRLLRTIALTNPKSLFNTDFISQYRLGSVGGVQNSLAKLKNLDLVEQVNGQWSVVNPLFLKWLKRC